LGARRHETRAPAAIAPVMDYKCETGPSPRARAFRGAGPPKSLYMRPQARR